MTFLRALISITCCLKVYGTPGLVLASRVTDILYFMCTSVQHLRYAADVERSINSEWCGKWFDSLARSLEAPSSLLIPTLRATGHFSFEEMNQDTVRLRCRRVFATELSLISSSRGSRVPYVDFLYQSPTSLSLQQSLQKYQDYFKENIQYIRNGRWIVRCC